MRSIEYPGYSVRWHQTPENMTPQEYYRELKEIYTSDFIELRHILVGIRHEYLPGQNGYTYHTPIRTIHGFDVIYRRKE